MSGIRIGAQRAKTFESNIVEEKIEGKVDTWSCLQYCEERKKRRSMRFGTALFGLIFDVPRNICEHCKACHTVIGFVVCSLVPAHPTTIVHVTTHNVVSTLTASLGV